MSGHTPGPWRAAPRNKTSNFGARIIRIDNWPGNPRVPIAEIHYREGNPAPEANALLLAASPELADALEGLLAEATGSYCEWCRAHAPKDHDGALIGPVPHTAGCPAVVARAALAKAGRALVMLACVLILTLAGACASASPRDPCAEPCSADGRPCVYYQGQCHPAQQGELP